MLEKESDAGFSPTREGLYFVFLSLFPIAPFGQQRLPLSEDNNNNNRASWWTYPDLCRATFI